MLIVRSAISPWVNGHEASKKLGFSEKSLKCWINCGYLKAGKHWCQKNDGTHKLILYNLEQCNQEMNEWWGRNALTEP